MPPWELVSDKLLHILLPGFLTAAVLAFFLVRYHRGGLAVLAGLFVANYFSQTLPWWPEDLGWPLLLGASAVVILPLDLLGGQRLQSPGLRAATAVWVGAVAIFLLFADVPVERQVAGGTIVVATYLTLSSAATKIPAWWLLTGLAGTALTAAVLFAFAHSGRFSDLGLMLAVCTAGTALPYFWKSDQAGTVFAIPSLFLPSLLLVGQQDTYSEVPPAAFFLIAAAPLSAAAAALLHGRVKKGLAVAFTALLWLGCLAVALALAVRYESIEF